MKILVLIFSESFRPSTIIINLTVYTVIFQRFLLWSFDSTATHFIKMDITSWTFCIVKMYFIYLVYFNSLDFTKKLYTAQTLCFILLDGAAIFSETIHLLDIYNYFSFERFAEKNTYTVQIYCRNIKWRITKNLYCYQHSNIFTQSCSHYGKEPHIFLYILYLLLWFAHRYAYRINLHIPPHKYILCNINNAIKSAGMIQILCVQKILSVLNNEYTIQIGKKHLWHKAINNKPKLFSSNHDLGLTGYPA